MTRLAGSALPSATSIGIIELRPRHACPCGSCLRKSLNASISWWLDEDDGEELETIPNGWAEVDPRDPRYSVFRVEVEVKPGYRQTLKLYRGSRLPNTP